MSLRKLFSENLQRLSKLRKSHAEVARAIGVNRQQYNNYLYGKNLPNEAIIERLCAYFEIEHAELFRKPDVPTEIVTQFAASSFLEFAAAQSRKAKVALKPGWYHIVFRSARKPAYHAVYAMQVKRRAGMLEFRRFSHIGLSDSVTHFVSFHKGLVVEARENIYLMSFDIFDDGSPTLLIGRPVISSVVSFAGKSLVRAGPQEEIVPFAIVPVREEAHVARHFSVARFYEPDRYACQPEVSAVLDLIT